MGISFFHVQFFLGDCIVTVSGGKLLGGREMWGEFNRFYLPSTHPEEESSRELSNSLSQFFYHQFFCHRVGGGVGSKKPVLALECSQNYNWCPNRDQLGNSSIRGWTLWHHIITKLLVLPKHGSPPPGTTLKSPGATQVGAVKPYGN